MLQTKPIKLIAAFTITVIAWCGFTPAALGYSPELATTHFFTYSNSLASYWPLNGNSNDFKGSSNGSDTSITYNAANGKFKLGGGFNGTSSIINVGTAFALNPTAQLTVNAWFNSTNTATFQAIATRDTVVAVGNDRCWGLYLLSGTVYAEVHGSSTSATLNGNTTPPSNAWNMATMTYDGSKLRVYLNGVLDSTPANAPAILFQHATATFIGKRGNSTAYFGGAIDDVTVFSRALTAPEILSLYNQTRVYPGYTR